LPTSQRLKPFQSLVKIEQRISRYQQQPFTLLISGLSGSGKTTIAQALEKRLFESGQVCVVLDGQSMRLGLCRDLGFSTEERSENLRRAAEIARLLNDAGLICLAAFVSPHEDTRQRVKNLIGAARVIHVHLTAPSITLQARENASDVAILATKRSNSDQQNRVDYEAPESADLTLDTESASIDQCVKQVVELLEDRGFFGTVTSSNS